MAEAAFRPTRRTLVRSAAWSVPVVSLAAAAPAFATSTCADGAYRLRWQNYSSSTKKGTAERLSTSGTGAIGTADVTVTVSSVFGGKMVAGSTGGYANLAASPGNIGGTGAQGLTIMQRVSQNPLPTPRSDNNQVVTLKFNRPVWDLKFSLTDIDSMDGQYQDRIFVSGSPSFSRGSQVAGDGSSSVPWRPTGTNVTQDPVTGVNGNVIVDYTGLPSSDTYTITYWNNQSGGLNANGLQGVFVSTMTFSSESGC